MILGFIEYMICLNNIKTENLQIRVSALYPNQIIYRTDSQQIISASSTANMIDTKDTLDVGKTEIITRILDGKEVQVIRQKVIVPPGVLKWRCIIRGSPNEFWYENF